MGIRRPVGAVEVTAQRRMHGKVWRRDGQTITHASTCPMHWDDNGTVRDIDFTPVREGSVLRVSGPVAIDIENGFVGFTYTAPTGILTARMVGAVGTPQFYEVENSVKSGFLWVDVFADVDVRILLLPVWSASLGRTTVTCMPHTIIKTPGAPHAFEWEFSGDLTPRPPVCNASFPDENGSMSVAVDTQPTEGGHIVTVPVQPLNRFPLDIH